MNATPATASRSAGGPPAPATQLSSYSTLARAFTLLEVVIAMAMLAVIALPALGLAALAVRQGDKRMSAGAASELKSRVEAHLASTENVFAPTFSIKLGASEDLLLIEQIADTGLLSNGERPYFKIALDAAELPEFALDDPYRIVNYVVTWPELDPELPATEVLVFTSVFRK